MNKVIITNGKVFIDDVEIKNLDLISIYGKDDENGIRIDVTFTSKNEDKAND